MSLIKFLIGIFVCFLVMPPVAILTIIYLFIKEITDIGNDFFNFLKSLKEKSE